MKALTTKEVELLAASLSFLKGARLQELRGDERTLGLLLWSQGETHQIIIDLNPRGPIVLPLNHLKLKKAPQKPLFLFLKAHFLGKILVGVEASQDFGRVLYLNFSGERVMEVRLFPHGQNILLKSEGKTISFKKPKNLEPMGKAFVPETHRCLDQLIREWEKNRNPSQGPSPKPGHKQENSQEHDRELKKLIAKKEKAIEKVKLDLEKKESSPHQKIGEWIKANQSLDVSSEYKSLIDPQKSLSANIETLFQKAKSIKKSIQGTQERLMLLKKELEDLKLGKLKPGPVEKGQKSKRAQSLFSNIEAKGRTVQLSSGHSMYSGKSGKDNLKLLREAKAWDLWLHLKDFPGSHGIIKKNKSEELSDQLLKEASVKLIEGSFKKSQDPKNYDHFEVVIAECRHVKPIKGDRLGRVTYQKAKTLRVKTN